MNIGLILAGGISKGAYQVGALKALEKRFPLEDFRYVSAASIGALNAYSFMSRQLPELENIWHSVNQNSDSVFFSSLLKGSFLPEAIGNVVATPVICDRFYFPLVTIKIKQRNLLYINICKENDKEDRAKLMRASVAVPVFSKPVEINGENYYDGAVIDNVPSTKLVRFDPEIDFYIAMYFDASIRIFDEADDPEGLLEAKTLKICFDDNTRVKNAAFMTKESITNMIDEGERMADEIFNFLLDKPDWDVEYIRSRLDECNTKYAPVKQKKITFSRALTTLNKVTERIVTKKEDDSIT